MQELPRAMRNLMLVQCEVLHKWLEEVVECCNMSGQIDYDFAMFAKMCINLWSTSWSTFAKLDYKVDHVWSNLWSAFTKWTNVGPV